MCNTYQGYTNYQTWAIELWIDNDQSAYKYWYNDRARACATVEQLADELKSEHASDEYNPLANHVSAYADILTWALNNVNWREIAQNIWDSAHENDEDEDEDDEPDENGNDNMRCDQCNASVVSTVFGGQSVRVYLHEKGCP